MNNSTTHEAIGFYQKYDELDKGRVLFCPYDGGKLRFVLIADGGSDNLGDVKFIPATKKCGFCGFSI